MKGKKKFNAEITEVYTCLPNDIDYYLHMNNASYLNVMEWARARYGYESGLLDTCTKNGWGFVIAGVSYIYKKEVKLFQRIYTS